MNLMFRPQDHPKRFTLKERLKFGKTQNYNFCNRIKWWPAGWKYNQQVIGGIHSRLHYLACHAPTPITKKWEKTYKEFQTKHFGNVKLASVRYLNNWSCHRWM